MYLVLYLPARSRMPSFKWQKSIGETFIQYAPGIGFIALTAYQLNGHRQIGSEA